MGRAGRDLAVPGAFAIVAERANQAVAQRTDNLMMRVTVAERLKLSALVGRRAVRNVLGRANAHPLLRWRYGAARTDRLLIAPQDLRTADATRAPEIYSGRFAFAGTPAELTENAGVLDSHLGVSSAHVA